MSAITIPTPGGANVGLAKFAFIAAGAGLGVALMQQYGLRMLPEAAYNWAVGPVGGVAFWSGVGAILGGAGGAMLSSKF